MAWNPRQLNWWVKFAVCVAWDGLDFTVGRTLFPVPFAGELAGTLLASALFGKAGLVYLFEALDVTEQIDGFAPTATLIALANRGGAGHGSEGRNRSLQHE